MLYRYSEEAAEFVATAKSRETDVRVMEAIVFFARSTEEAERVWDGDFRGVCTPLDIWEHATKNGILDASEMQWGQTDLDEVAT